MVCHSYSYEAALSNWPDSYVIWMGLGNSYYSLSNLSKAILAFRKATEIQPKNGIAFNNLAHILAETGKREEALAAAQKAVTCGGPLLETFKKTLSEIQECVVFELFVHFNRIHNLNC